MWQPNTEILEIIVAMAESRNMVEASRRLGLSQPAVSAKLKLLEQQSPISVFVFQGKKKILTRFAELDVLGVCVTFLDEISSLNEKTVSMVAAIVPENPSQRTFRIDRRPANGLSYAVALAEKYHLTYELLKKRINP